MPTDEQTIRALIETRNAAIAANDLMAVVAPLAHDVVAYSLQPPLAYVGEAARDTGELARWIATWDAPPRIAMPQLAIRVDGDLAVAHGLCSMNGNKTGGGTVSLWYRATLVFARRRGAWTIVHEHESVPMKMDGSMLAAVELQPQPVLGG